MMKTSVNKTIGQSAFAVVLLLAVSATAQVNYGVSGSYAYVASSPNASGNIVIASTYYGYPVVDIANYAFSGCANLTSVTIPNGVTSIDYSAFYSCTSLTGITIPNSVTSIGDNAFSHCTSLTNVTIPNSVGSIGNNAFDYCTRVTSVTIGNSVTSIGSQAFTGCSSLTNFSVGAANSAFSSLGGVLFNKAQTTLMLFPVGRGGSYVIPGNITSIWYNAFFLCTNLTSVTIPNSVASILNSAFAGCWSLTSVAIPNSVTNIGSQAFTGCSSLTNFSVGVANSAYSSLDGVLFNKAQTTLIQFPTGRGGSYAIPGSVTSIEGSTFGAGAFTRCTSLTSVTILNSVTNIGDSAFSYCSSLTSVTIPDSVIELGYGSFSYCTSLTSVTIGNSVPSMPMPFRSCTSLTNLTFLGNAPSSPYSSIGFNIPTGATVYYYYGTTGWGPTYYGLPAVMLGAPVPQVGTGSAGVKPGGFGFTVNGVTNQTIVVEASTNLVNWQPIWTNTLAAAAADFVDLQSPNLPKRFYRIGAH